MLAVVDWALPYPQSIRLCSEELDINVDGPQVLKNIPSLNIPDCGTVWELGVKYCALAAGPRIFLFTERPPGGKMNIMLAQCADGVIYGLPKLKEFLNAIARRGNASRYAPPYEGQYT